MERIDYLTNRINGHVATQDECKEYAHLMFKTLNPGASQQYVADWMQDSTGNWHDMPNEFSDHAAPRAGSYHSDDRSRAAAMHQARVEWARMTPVQQAEAGDNKEQFVNARAHRIECEACDRRFAEQYPRPTTPSQYTPAFVPPKPDPNNPHGYEVARQHYRAAMFNMRPAGNIAIDGAKVMEGRKQAKREWDTMNYSQRSRYGTEEAYLSHRSIRLATAV